MSDSVTKVIGVALIVVGYVFYAYGGQFAITAGIAILASIKKPPPTSGGWSTEVNLTGDPTAPRSIVYGEVWTGGDLRFRQATGTDNNTLYMVIVLAGHSIDSIVALRIDNEDAVLDGSGDVTLPLKLAGYCNVRYYMGSDSQTADSTLDTAFTEWTSNHRLRGLPYAIVKLTFNESVMASPPAFRFLIRGRKVYDPRLDSTNGGSGAHRLATESTWAWSRNAILCHNDFDRGVMINGKLVAGWGLATSRFSWPNVIAEANVCDEDVSLAAGGTQDRYTVDGVIDPRQPLGDIKRMFEAAYAGDSLPSDNLLRYFTGAYRTPTLSLGPQHYVGPVHLIVHKGELDKKDQARGRFTAIGSLGNTVSYTPVSLSGATAGFERVLTLDFQLVGDSTNAGVGVYDGGARAQRVAKLLLEKDQAGKTITVSTNLYGLRAMPGETIYFTHATFGLSSQAMRVVEVTLKFQNDDAGKPGLVVDLTLEAGPSSLYTWSASEVAIAASPPIPQLVVPPITVLNNWTPVLTNVSRSGNTYTKTDGTGYTAQVYSAEKFNSVKVESRGPDTNNLSVMYGLNTDPTTDAIWTSIDFGFDYDSDGNLRIVESGTIVSNLGAYSGGAGGVTPTAIDYDGLVVRYSVGGNVVRTVWASGLALYLDSSFHGAGVVLNQLLLTPQTVVEVGTGKKYINNDPGTQSGGNWTTYAGTNWEIAAITDGKASGYELRSVAAADQAWVIESARYPVDTGKAYKLHAWARRKSGNRGVYLVCNFFDSAGALIAGSSIGWLAAGTSYYWGLAFAGTTELPADSVWREYMATFGLGQLAQIPSGAKTMALGAILNYQGVGTTDGVVAVQDLWVDVLPLTAGGTSWPMDADGKPAGWRGVNGVADRARLSFDAAGRVSISGAGNSAFGLPAIAVDDTQTYTLRWRDVSNGSSATGLYVRVIEKSSALVAGTTHVGFPSGAAEPMVDTETSYIDVVSNGAMPGTIVTEHVYTYKPTAGAKFASLSFYNWGTTGVAYAIESVTLTRVGSDVNLLTTTMPVDPALGWTPVLSQGMVRNGKTFTKVAPGANDTWDAAFSSAEKYGACQITAQPANATDLFMFGLNSDPTTDNSYSSIDFAVYGNGGTFYVYESAASQGSFGTYVANDVLSVQCDGVKVRYLKNGVVLYTSAATPAKALYADSSFFTLGAVLNNVDFGPIAAGLIDLSNQISGTLTTAFAAAGLINANVTINADGTLTGAGAGQASLTNLPGQVQVGSIAANAVTTGTLAALAVTAAKIAANTISANEINATLVWLNDLNVSTGGKIRSGQTAYDTGTGYWLEYNGGTPRFSLGNSAGNKMTWDGSGLTVVGTVSGALAASSLTGTVGLGNTNIAARGWTNTTAFSVTDSDTIAWAAGTFTSADGTSYSIAGGNTGNMSARTYIYLDVGVSTTAFQTTTTAANAIGSGRVLIATAVNGTGEARYAVFGGAGGQNIDAADIVAGTVTANELAASITFTNELILSSTGKIRKAKTSASDTTKGIWLGDDGASGDDFHVGDASSYFWFDYSAATLKFRGNLDFAFQTYTPTWTGWGTAPSGTLSYLDFGSFFILLAPSVMTATSNGSTFRFTLPFTLANDASGSCTAINNGTTENDSWIVTSVVSLDTVIMRRSAPPVESWTSSGTKGLPSGWLAVIPK